jgi:hypothetical protein
MALVQNIDRKPLILTGGHTLQVGQTFNVDLGAPNEAALYAAGSLALIDGDIEPLSDGQLLVTAQASVPFSTDPRAFVMDVADGTPGVHAIGVDGNPIPTGTSAAITSLEAYGHSWVAAYGTTAAKYGMVARLAKLLHCTTTSVALTGGYVAGITSGNAVGALLQSSTVATDLTAGPYLTPGGLKVCMNGYNDYAAYAAYANSSTLVENALALAFSRLLAARVINAASAATVLNTAGGLTYSSGWASVAVVDSAPACGPGVAYHTVNGNYVEFTTDAAYNGEAITAQTAIGPGAAFVTLSVDGVTMATVDGNALQAVLASAGVAGAATGIRLPAGTVAAGAHTIRVTFTAINAAAYFGGFIIEGSAPLLVPSYPDRPGVTPGTGQSLAARWSNARNKAALASFPSGVYVDLAPAMCPNYGTANEATDNRYWYDGGHPNNLGYARVTEALLQAARAIPASRLALMS